MIDECGIIGQCAWSREGTVATVFRQGLMEPATLIPNDTIELTFTRTIDTNGEIITTKYPTYTWTGKKFTSSYDKPSPLQTLTNKTLDWFDEIRPVKDEPKFPPKEPWWKK